MSDEAPIVDEATAAEETVTEVVELDYDLQARLWVRAITPVLQLTPSDPPPSDRVQFALDSLFIAAAERLIRIFHSDRPADHTDES